MLPKQVALIETALNNFIPQNIFLVKAYSQSKLPL